MPEKVLYFGGGADLLRRHMGDESVDLIYDDPVWDLESPEPGAPTEEAAPPTPPAGKVGRALEFMQDLIADPEAEALLARAAERLVEFHRVLRPEGSLYLHTDPRLGPYLRLLADAVFGPDNHLNDIVLPLGAGYPGRAGCRRVHDTLLFYARQRGRNVMNRVFQEHDPRYVQSHYRHRDARGRRYRTSDLTASGRGSVGHEYTWNNVDRVWRVSEEEMKALGAAGRIHYTRSGLAEYIRYLDEMPGMPLRDIWSDLPPLSPRDQEPAEGPGRAREALLTRVISAGSREGQVFLAASCGAGAALVAAERLGRSWIGLTASHLDLAFIRYELRRQLGDPDGWRIVGEPTAIGEAVRLAQDDERGFRWWVLGRVGARPVVPDVGPEAAVHGRLTFTDAPRRRERRIVFRVKIGALDRTDVNRLREGLAREKARLGVLISLTPPVEAIRREAAEAGMYDSPWGKYPVLQLLSVNDLFAGKGIQAPPRLPRPAPLPRRPEAALDRLQLDLLDEG
jgi:hypothetical protein